MRYLPILLLSLACSSLPEPGTPEASDACAQLVATVIVLRSWPPGDESQEEARHAFYLQAADYAERLHCGPIGLPAPYELPRGDMTDGLDLK